MRHPKPGDKRGAELAVFKPDRLLVAEALRRRPNGFWTVDEMAAHTHTHRTVAFDHLQALVEAGVASRVSVRGGRGRPANAYRYAGTPLEVSYPPQRTRLLARVLSRSVGGSSSVRAEARQLAYDAGRQEGGLDHLGGDYQVSTGRIHAHTCIFGSVCPDARDVVCEMHAGLVEGALEAEGRASTVIPEGPDGMGGCLFRVA